MINLGFPYVERVATYSLATASSSLTVTEVTAILAVCVAAASALVSNARIQSAMRESIAHTRDRLKRHSDAIDKTEVDLLRTSIRAEQNERDIADLKVLLTEVRDTVLRIEHHE